MSKFGYMNKKSTKEDKFSIKGKRKEKKLETKKSMKIRKKLIKKMIILLKKFLYTKFLKIFYQIFLFIY